MKVFKVLLALAMVLAVTSAKNYKNHKVVTFTIENEEQLKELQALEKNSGVTFLEAPETVNAKIAIVIQSDLFGMFEEVATATGLVFKVTSDDLQKVIDSEKPKKQPKAFGLDKYNTLEEMDEFMAEMAIAHKTASVFTVGRSFEGRTIKGIKIATNMTNPAVFIEANIHAREWISSATALWLIDTILTSSDPELREIFDNITWYIVPVTNPDGFAYTHDEVDGDRLWRKTKSRHNIFCMGVDPNRNFGYNWMMGGSSAVPCSTTYAGPSAFSEPETRALMNYYETVPNKMLYLCFHSAAKMLIYPLGHTLETKGRTLLETDDVPNVEHLDTISKAAVAALKERYNTEYIAGNGYRILYQTSGSSRDHAYGHYKTPLVFTYEMREGPENIFILPPEQIIPNSQEVLDSLVAIIKTGKSLGYFNASNL